MILQIVSVIRTGTTGYVACRGVSYDIYPGCSPRPACPSDVRSPAAAHAPPALARSRHMRTVIIGACRLGLLLAAARAAAALPRTMNVRNFGAIRDGVAKDDAAIQGAINIAQQATNGTAPTDVYFPKGVYLLDKTLLVNGPASTRLVGDGRQLSWLVAGPGLRGSEMLRCTARRT